MDWLAGAGGFPFTLCLAAVSGRHGADNVAGGPARQHHTKGRFLSPRCPWRGTRIYGLPGQARRCVQEGRGRPGRREGRSCFGQPRFLPHRRTAAKFGDTEMRFARSTSIGDALDRIEAQRNCDPTPFRTSRQGQREDKERPHVWCSHAGPPATLSAPRRPLAAAGHTVDGKPSAPASQSISRPTPLAPWRGPRGWE